MIGEWCYFKQYFSADICDYILKTGLILPSKQAELGVDGNIFNDQYRRSKIRFLQKTDSNFSFLFDEMWKLAIQANDQWFNFNISKLDYIQLAEYNSIDKGEYKRHHDVFWMNGDPKYHRKLTAIVQLSDPETYTGGDFELIALNSYPDKHEIRSRGTVFFFPSFLEHQANQVLSGTRYSLACWFDGPKWC